MAIPTQLVRRCPISTFAVLACVLGWMPYILAGVGIGSHPENIPLGPALAALVVTSCQGREALRAWGRSLRRWAASPWLYTLAVLAPIVLHVSIVLVNHALGAPLPTATQLGAWPEVPVTFLVMLVMVGLGEEAGWTAFAAPVLLRRFGLLGAFAVLAPLRILWHLPLMITGDMPVVVGILGNAGFQLIVLLMVRHHRGSWTLAAVWHATLNAFGGAFFFSMVTGPDRDRLDLLLGLEYALVAVVALALTYVFSGRSHSSGAVAGGAAAAAPRSEHQSLVG
ncbi:CAAX protease self-immunity [Nocardioides alpinus]|uniref:CAAX protease self-immunity n=1 Tax=Nocardioides alpinus TaxID=748909 RepID=A0A1I0VA30_9ACTN|nr:CPBP family intramembrane glutamic endopeptidase [Nocardioides alpinus]PKH37156.1 CPBP family intramembrane metalloprotease [Nocardioides alpinus]SFA73175.1 CAAX protease self-immunity [Nocardioides alpinus]